MTAERKYGDKPSRPIYVWNGILEPKHRKRIGPAIWLFLYFIDRTTKERQNKNNPGEIEGWVYGKMPLTLERMAEETGIPERTISRYLVTLEGYEYIRTVRTPHGLIILVQKSSKWPNGKKSAKSGESLLAKSGESPAISGDSPAKSGECRKDKAVDLSGDERIGGENTAHGAVSLPDSISESQSQPQERSNPNPERQPLSLREQIEEVKRRGLWKSPGKVVEMQPQEATA